MIVAQCPRAMQHDIIDNRERKLIECIRPLLSEAERAKFAVGYFSSQASMRLPRNWKN